VTDQKKSAATLHREARELAAQARAAEARENVEANDPDKAQSLKDAIAQAENPERRSRYAKQTHRNSPAFKAAKEHAREVLGEVRETLVQLRRADVELDPADRAELIEKVAKGIPARMADRLRKAAAEMLDDQSGDLNRVDETMRAAVIEAADKSPHVFDRPESDERPVSDILAAIPWQG